ncbi:unnamed protein product [Caenorhabditis bovis]|uniref:UPAR/Ly6 domain-containing protein n=1 Tax=Caenorhabditis bovis TaxID=2654633 RepID=A0A8S1EBB0_9PELO|nr:unnamed protein product [Caenorhabditis bovis]
MSQFALVALILAAFIIPNVDSIRCYDYTKSSVAKNAMKTWIDCPAEAQYCYKSYLETRDFNDDKTWVEGRACGTPNLCIVNGCVGSKTDKACCCRDELCNSSSTSKILASLLTIIAFFALKN